MNHKVNNVQQLFDDSKFMFDNVVKGDSESSADSIMKNLMEGIEVLKNSWEGKDAGVQINSVIEIYNAMVILRNALGSLASDSSKVASNYRMIQVQNGAGLDQLPAFESSDVSPISTYEDNRDTISITQEANTGKSRIDTANNAFEAFISSVRQKYDAITENWVVGTGRNKADQAFSEFLNNSSKYRETLSEVSQSITEAITNYNF